MDMASRLLPQRLRTLWRSSLRAKITLSIVLPLVLVLGVFTAIEYTRHREATLANLSFVAAQTSQVIENSLQHEMLSHNLEGVQHMLDGVAQDDKIRDIYLLNTDGKVVFAPQNKQLGEQLDNHDPTCQPCHRLPAANRPSSVVVTLPDGQRIFRSMDPLENREACHKCHDADERLTGVLLTDIWVAPFETQLQSGLLENLLWWTGTVAVAVIVTNVVTSRLVIRRLEQVARSLTRFGQGQRDVRLPNEDPDEIGQLTTAFNDMGQRLLAEETQTQTLTEDLRALAAERYELLKRLITAQEEERRRVARDLHDGLGQDLAGLAFRLEAVERLGAEQARAHVHEVRAQIAETTNRVYDMILALRPSSLDDLGLAPALRAHAERTFKDTGVQFELEARDLARRLPPEIETALFRTFQEGLHNIARHAQAQSVQLTLTAPNGYFEGTLSDDGCGFDMNSIRPTENSPRGLGLMGMQERIAHCGGTLEIQSRPGRGTRLSVRVPLPKAAHD